VGSSLRRWAVLLAVVPAFALASCGVSGEVAEPSPSATELSLGPLGAPDCQPASPSLGQEAQGTGSGDVTAYGLLFVSDAASIPGDGSTNKMVVRMTGDGEMLAHLVAPDGSERPLVWGPEQHGGSTFRRPGDEWGIGFAFDAPGCWQVALERANGDRADFWFDVKE